jgi:hypothetical protein
LLREAFALFVVSMQNLSKLLMLLILSLGSSWLIGHVIMPKSPLENQVPVDSLPDPVKARQQYAFALGYDYGQRFRTQNNHANLPVEAFIEGLRTAANGHASSVDPNDLRLALLAIQTDLQSTQPADPHPESHLHPESHPQPESHPHP